LILGLLLGGCDNPASSPSNQELADEFKAGQSAILEKTTNTVAVSDEEAVDAALTAYAALDAGVKTLLATEKTKLDALKAKIGELKTAASAAESAAAFRAGHAGILGKTVNIVALSDDAAVEAALTAYAALSADAKALLTAEKEKLDALNTKIEDLKKAAAFKTAHSAALALTVVTVTTANEAAVNAALADYAELSEGARALLAAEMEKLGSLKTKLEELNAPGDSASFKTAHSAVLALTVATVTTANETAVNAALAAYNGLSPAAKEQLTAEKTKLDDLKTKLEELNAPAVSASFKTTHSAALALTVGAVTMGDEAAVNAALTAYNALSSAAKALLTAEKTKLDDLKTKIEELKAEAAAMGTKTVNVAFAESGALTSGNTANLSLDRSEMQILTVTAADGLTDIRWSLNDTDFPPPRGAAQSITLAAVNYPAGVYLLGLAVKKDGVDYSAVITFTVVE
jgi:hypothetical protein